MATAKPRRTLSRLHPAFRKSEPSMTMRTIAMNTSHGGGSRIHLKMPRTSVDSSHNMRTQIMPDIASKILRNRDMGI